MSLYTSTIRPTLILLGPDYRRKGLFVLPLLLLQSLVDVLSVASFAPMALMVVRPESVRANPFLIKLYFTFSFESEQSFALAWVVGIAVLFLVKHVMSILITRIKARYAFGVSAFLSERMLSRLIKLEYIEYHDLQSSAEQVKIAHLPISFANNILLGIATLFTEGLILFMLMVSLMVYDWRSVFFLMMIILPAIVFYRIIKKKINEINHSLKTNYPGLIHHILRLFENFLEINLYQRKAYFVQKVRKQNHDLHQSQILQTILQANSFRLFETTAAVGLCLLVLYTQVMHTSPDTTTLLLGLYTVAGFRAVPSLNRIFVALLQIKTNEHVVAGLTKFSTQEKACSPQVPIHFNETLDLNNLSFGFAGKPLILVDCSLSITKGQRIALMGASGCGKTTLLLLIMRFLKETRGEIRVDGCLLEDCHIDAWRKHLAYVPQSPVILDGSIIENIAFGMDPKEADIEKIQKLLPLLGLGQWLNQLPDGLMTQFGERGIKLSGGQRQRLVIARALYSEAEVLLFDEATNQVDAITETEVYEALNATSHQSKTIIMVTHHKTSLHFFDKVYHLEGGQIRES